MQKSDWKLRVANALLLIGVIGFVGCWVMEFYTETRVFGDASFTKPSVTRTEAIRVKNSTYYVEPNYGWYFRKSDQLIFVSFAMALLGGGYVEHRKRRGKYPWS